VTDEVAERQTFEYRPHLDGLRTLAVYLVVVFHAGAGKFSGGFIGVDLFFVLSGYLVTHVLISDLWSSSGSVSLATFYSRRVRRLLPAAVVTLLATAALFTLVASPLEARASVDSFRAAFLYFANWHFIGASTDYFAGDVNADPVLHYWSLSIEEQFYFVWPLVLIGLTGVRRRASRGDAIVRGFVALLVVASALWAIQLSSGNVNRAYYGTDARAYQLLAGALLAMSPSLVTARLGAVGRRVASVVGAVALITIVVLGSSLIDMGPIARGIATTVTTITALVALERSRNESLVRRVLSTETLVYLGKISYGTYLWHWPVIIVLDRVLVISDLATAVIASVVATGLASLSSRVLELRVLRSKVLQQVPRLVAIGGVTAGVLVGILVVPEILQRDLGSRPAVVAGGNSDSDVPGDPSDDGEVIEVDWLAASKDIAEPFGCIGKPVEQCLLIEGSGPRILLLGDSHGIMLRPALEEIAKRRDYALYLAADFGCSWAIGLATTGQEPNERELCFEMQNDWYDRVIPELDPDLVLVIQRAVDDPDRPIAMVGDGSVPDDDQGALLLATAERTFQRLSDLEQPVAIIESIPVAANDRDPLECLSLGTNVDDCRYFASRGKTPLEKYYATQAADGKVYVVNIDTAVCPSFPVCDPVIDGVVAKWDSTHLTATYSRAISDQIEHALDEAGALP
jgi:peptidoglycan/LPS O-acetylase OafA/YrhL